VQRQNRRSISQPSALGFVGAMRSDVRDAVEIWRQTEIPVVYRPGDSRLQVKLPFAEGNGDWLRNGKRTNPEWNSKFRCWKVPQSWLDDVIRRALQRYQRVYVIQPFREEEKCAPACRSARGFKCTCSCMGKHHGSEGDGSGWFIVSETYQVRRGDRVLACRLIEPSQT
jgi:hypothetical protein